MRLNFWLLNSFFVLIVVGAVQAADLNGTSSLVYQTDHYVFRNGDNATGLVALKGGFTIESGTATIDILLPMSGDIDLKGSSTCMLAGDISFASDVTTTGGGNISGQAITIFLGGDWTIPEGVTLAFSSDTVINGKGHTILFEPSGKFQLDEGVTVTIKNAVLVSNNNSLTLPFLRMAASSTQLALDNVVVRPSGDYCFEDGQLFIHNSVRYTGTSTFKYQSSQRSFIAPKSCLTFDQDTTFYYNPGTSDDDLLQLQDSTSDLRLDGSSIVLSTTGMRLSRGRLIIDNHVTFSTQGDSLSQGIKLGKKSGGVSENLDIHLLSAATLDIHGTIVNDLVAA